MKRFLFSIACLLLAMANWPLVVLLNRIEPMVLGLPFMVFSMLALNILVAALLAVAYRISD